MFGGVVVVEYEWSGNIMTASGRLFGRAAKTVGGVSKGDVVNAEREDAAGTVRRDEAEGIGPNPPWTLSACFREYRV